MKDFQANEIILYQPDDTLSIDVRVEDESVWLTQAQMAELFQTTRNNVTLHTRNIFKEGELIEQSVCKESLLTANDYTKAHDRFIIIDEDVYHIGASLKDLGKKLFAFSKMEVMTGTQLTENLE